MSAHYSQAYSLRLPSFQHRNTQTFHLSRRLLLMFPETCARIFVGARYALSIYRSVSRFADVVRSGSGAPFAIFQFILSDSATRLSADFAICRRRLLVSGLIRYSRAGEEIAKPDDVDSVLIGNSVHQIPIN